MAVDNNPYGLTPETLAEIAAFNLADYQKGVADRNSLIASRDANALAAARGTGASNIDMYVNNIGYDEIIPGSTANIMAGIGMYDPKYEAVMRTYGSENDSNNPIDVTERSTFAVDPNAAYRLVDNKTGKVIAEASNLSDVRGLVDMANSTSKDQGKNADWSLEAGTQFPTNDKNNPMETQWNTVARDDPSKMMDGALGAVMDIALPVLLSAVVPGAGLLGTMLPAAGGAAISSALQERSLEETLIRSALAGATAGIGEKFINPALNSVLNPAVNAGSKIASEVISDVAANAAANAAGQGIGEIIVNGIPTLVSGIGSGIGSALGSGISSALTNAAASYVPPAPASPPPAAEPAPEPAPEAGGLVVNAIRNPVLNAGVTGLSSAIPQYVASNYGTYEPEEPVTRKNPDTGEDEIIVTAHQPVLLPSVTQALINQTLPEFTKTPEIVQPDKSVGDYLKDAAKVVGAASTLVPLAGQVFGGSGGGGSSGIGNTGPGLTYNPTVLTPTITAETVRAAGGHYPFDPNTYGRAGGDQETEYEFFTRALANASMPPATVPANAGGHKGGGKIAHHKLKYEDLSPEEKNAVDYHRRNLAADMVRHNEDGSGSSYIGAINEMDGRETYYPTFWNGKELSREEAEKRVRQSGIEFPTYDNYEEGLKREKRIHDDIMTSEMNRYLKGDRSFLEGYAGGGEMHDDMVKHLVEYQKGGGHRGPGKVTGIGSGQEDLIPAWLSDGEYVWSAQDVADLGDGSTDEGVRRLDKMRQMVRKQAGRKDVKKIAKPQKGIDTMIKAVGGPV